MAGPGGEPGCPRPTSLAGRVHCAARGWVEAWRSQENLRIQVAIALGVTALGLFLGLGLREWAILVLAYGLVLGAELLNSALEAVTDLASPAYDPRAGRAKDMAAGGVLLVSVVAAVVGVLVLGPPLWARVAGLLGLGG
jgi:diacylglycerol kinase